MREAAGIAYRFLVAGCTSLDFPELDMESKPSMENHFLVENNNHSSSAKKAPRRYYTSREMGRAAQGRSLMTREGSSADT
jgi:hypothetical protein